MPVTADILIGVRCKLIQQVGIFKCSNNYCGYMVTDNAKQRCHQLNMKSVNVSF